MPESDPEKMAKLAERGAKLRLDAAIAEVTAELGRQGIPARLLKGPSIAKWLYGDDERRVYNDCDLLLAPDQLEQAAQALEAMGYVRHFDDRGMPAWWREHGVALLRENDDVTFDLHHRLPGVRADEHVAWRILSAETDHVTVGGLSVPVLGLPARALHLALHAAQHGRGWAVPIDDLERGMAQLDDALWRRAHALAVKLHATDAFVSGLRLAAQGERLARMLHLNRPREVEAILRASTPPPLALGFQQLAEAHGVGARMEILLRKAFPPSEFIRHWDPGGTTGRRGLVLAYVRRPAWLLMKAPAGFQAWRKARRAANEPG